MGVFFNMNRNDDANIERSYQGKTDFFVAAGASIAEKLAWASNIIAVLVLSLILTI